MNNILVCITDPINCNNIIQRLTEDKTPDDNLYIVYIDDFVLTEKEKINLESLYEKALVVGGNFRVIKTNNVVTSLEEFIKTSNIDIVYINENSNTSANRNIDKQLKSKLDPSIKMKIIT